MHELGREPTRELAVWLTECQPTGPPGARSDRFGDARIVRARKPSFGMDVGDLVAATLHHDAPHLRLPRSGLLRDERVVGPSRKRADVLAHSEAERLPQAFARLR